MSGVKKVSRQDLYDSESEISEDEVPILPKIEFDIIEADESMIQEDQEEEQDFDFPLFSMGKDQEKESELIEDRGRSETKQNTIRITLRSPSPEIINQERPKSYYFAEYNELERENFKRIALTGDDILEQSLQPSYGRPIGKVINLVEYNAKIERELKRKARPGKKTRMANFKSRENNKNRAKIQKEIEDVKKAKLLKKMHHKRGGKKHKKKTETGQKQNSVGKVEKPKYRTE